MDSTMMAALITSGVTLFVAYVWPWQRAISAALGFARTEHFPRSRVEYRNCKRRRLGTRLSIMVDVCGRRRGVYIILISRRGTVLKITPLHGWRPQC